MISRPRVRWLALLGASALALVLALPGSASANPVKDAVHTALNAAFDVPGASKVTDGFFLWLIAIPNFDGTAFANLMSRSNLVALALLTAVMTFSVVRYWLGAIAGVSDGGAAAGMEGLIRTGGAVLAIMLWPWLFENVTAIVNLTTRALLADGGVNTTRLIGASISLGSIFNPLGIAIKLLSFGMIIALVALKIFLVASLAALCAGAPFFIMLSPIRELAWVASNAGRALVVIWLAPIFWALELRAADAIRIHDLINPKGGGIGESLANELFLEPLVGLVIMYMLFKTPKHLRAGIAQATNATVGAPGHVPPGFMARAGSYLAAQVVGGMVLSRIDTTLGGRKQPDVVPRFTRDSTGKVRGEEVEQNVTPGTPRHRRLLQEVEDTTRRERQERNAASETPAARAKRESRERAPHQSEESWNHHNGAQATSNPMARVAQAAKRGRESDAAWGQRDQERHEAREQDVATFATPPTGTEHKGVDSEKAEGKTADSGAAPPPTVAEHETGPRRSAATGWSRPREARAVESDARAVESLLRDTEQPSPRLEYADLPEPVRSQVEADIAEFRLSEDSRR